MRSWEKDLEGGEGAESIVMVAVIDGVTEERWSGWWWRRGPKVVPGRSWRCVYGD